ncbi:hypothetical protein HK17_11590 [Acetobacter indonesiensis]|uniref:Uncharacterized protein n=1 Tax=Acetobacter indonesiensis TaxID=104101 RepID=A0A252ANJ6_9PROT|nr:hypothetical protein HK17_11590 [Acetobacter indonesiensis]
MSKFARCLFGSTLAGIAGLLTFAAPVPHQRVVTAGEISARAWGRTGSSLRKAMKAIDADAVKSGPVGSTN